ncbi:MAG: amidohydrolase [Chlorobiaceae bacterium]|nr:amidohydrolase [Chlorobiaceae bacterium]MBA4310180.1 amidohydrolase [Chlorobiaceae bacterium]
MKSNKLLLIIFLLLNSFLVSQEYTLIKNGNLLTVANGKMLATDLLIKDGKIYKIGKNLSSPAGTKIIDASDYFVMPGIIDAHSHMAIEDGVNEATNPITSEVKIEDAIEHDDISLYRALAGGVTTIHTMHGSANVIGGQCETLKLRYGKNPAELIFQNAPRTIKFALGENPIRVHGRGNNIHPRSRMGIEQIIRQAFLDAKQYKKEWEDFKNNQTLIQPKKDLRLEALVDVLDGEMIIHCHAYRSDEIIMLLNVLKEFDIKKVIFQHVLEGYKVAKELAEFGAYASSFADWWSYKFEVYYAIAHNPAILTNYGVITSINSDSPNLVRYLNLEAAKSMRYGNLNEDEALRLITINPAIQLGIDKSVGSLEVGKDADIAIFNRHPLSSFSRCEMTLIDGKIYFDRKNDPNDMRLNVNPNLPVGFDSFSNTLNDFFYNFCMDEFD